MLRRTIALGSALLTATRAAAQPAPPLVHLVTYIEAAPAQAVAAHTMLRTHRANSRTQAGTQAFLLLRRIDRPHHFALVGAWTTGAERDVHLAAAPAATLHAALKPMLAAPYDERPHSTLSVGPMAAPPVAASLFALTHVDVVPTQREAGAAAVRGLAEAGRDAGGNQRFDALIQESRTNHFTLVEAWASDAALTAHVDAPARLAFREALLPMSGSLYDQRLYRTVE